MPDNIPDIPEDADGALIEHNLLREVTSWKLAGLMASDGRAFLRCSFNQEVGGDPDPGQSGQFVNFEERSFTVHWELNSLKEFVSHLVMVASEIENRAGLVREDCIDIAPLLAGVGSGQRSSPGAMRYDAGYL